MGGQGSGRPPSERTIIARNSPNRDLSGDTFELPNLSGVKHQIRETDISTDDLEEGTTNLYFTNQRAIDAVSLSSETDPVFMALSAQFATASSTTTFTNKSGSNSQWTNDEGYLTNYTETDPIFMSLSSQFLTSYTETDPQFMALSSNFTTSSAFSSHTGDSSDPHGVNLSQTGITSSGTISGQNFVKTADFTTSGQETILNAVLGTNSTPPTASNFAQGSIYIQYTP